METAIEEKTTIGSVVKKIILSGGEFVNALKISYIMGLAFGAAGRAADANYISAIPPVIDLYHGAPPTPARLACYAAYSVGVATIYADKIYNAASELVDKL